MTSRKRDSNHSTMGCCTSGPRSEFVIYVRTGDKRNAGTDANVYIVLHDDQGNTTGKITLDNFLRNDFERGRMDTFPVPKSKLSALGKVTKIEVWRDDAGFGSDWYVERIMVENRVTNYIFVFPIFRWIKPDYHYMIKHLDTSLPQDDDTLEQRRMELEEKKYLYQYEQKLPGMPAQVHTNITFTRPCHALNIVKSLNRFKLCLVRMRIFFFCY